MDDRIKKFLFKVSVATHELSDDNHKQVGCVIVNDDFKILSYGSNSLPNGVKNENSRCEGDEKRNWLTHAERNAIYNAAREGVSLRDTNAFVTYFPCVDCTRGLIQVGVKKIYSPKPDFEHEKWGESWTKAYEMLIECGVEVEWIEED